MGPSQALGKKAGARPANSMGSVGLVSRKPVTEVLSAIRGTPAQHPSLPGAPPLPHLQHQPHRATGPHAAVFVFFLWRAKQSQGSEGRDHPLGRHRRPGWLTRPGLRPAGRTPSLTARQVFLASETRRRPPRRRPKPKCTAPALASFS